MESNKAGLPKRQVGKSDVIAKRIVIKVGLDEWTIIGKASNAELCTDGLSGCVAIVMHSDEQAYLAHVYSDARGKWATYEPKIKESIRNLVQPIKEVDLFKSDDQDTELATNLKNFFETRSATVTVRQAAGAKILYKLGLRIFASYPKTDEDKETYLTGYLNSEDAEAKKHIAASGFLSKSGAAASK